MFESWGPHDEFQKFSALKTSKGKYQITFYENPLNVYFIAITIKQRVGLKDRVMATDWRSTLQI